MADIYVRSTGSNTSPYSTWATAATTFSTAVTQAAAGDNIFIDSTHTESYGGNTTWVLPTSASSPVKVMSVNGSGDPEPPTALLAGAQVGGRTAANANFIWYGNARFHGITFEGGGGTGSNNDLVMGSNAAASTMTFENCIFRLVSTDNEVVIRIGSGSASGNEASTYTMIDCTADFGHIAQIIQLGYGRQHLVNLAIDATSSVITTLFKGLAGIPCDALIEASDLSGVAWTNFLDQSANTNGRVCAFNCKMPASFVPSIGTIAGPAAISLELVNCSDANTNYEYFYKDYAGTIETETTIILNSGDGTTITSWEMTTTANASLASPLVSPLLNSVWNTDVTNLFELEVEVVNDGATLTDTEIYLLPQALRDTTSSLGTVDYDDRGPMFLGSSSNQQTTTPNWITTGLTTPIRQRLSATTRAYKEGLITGRVYLTKASETVYVNRKMIID